MAAEGTGAKKTPLSEVTKNLFLVLSENGRLVETNGVIEAFQELVRTYKGELEVIVTSAAPLQKDVMTRLENSLKSSQTAQKAKSVKVTNKVRFFTFRTSQNLCCGRMLICLSYPLGQSGYFGGYCDRLWGQDH